MVIQLREATRADIPAITEIGVAAFDAGSHAIVHSLLPPHLQPVGTSEKDTEAFWLSRRIIRALSDPSATAVVAHDGGILVGCALWVVPHEEEVDINSSEPPPATPPNMSKEAVRELRAVLERSAEALFGEMGASKAWELDFLAIHPEHQRRGIGKSLLNWGTEQAKESSKDSYLIASTAGRPLYIAGGFEEIGRLDLFGEPHSQMIIKNDPKWKADTRV
ncbi:putative GNAT family acetyltransferase [Xylariales sp. PMI_506]|nr:putative GNAT family acetyltransferase [Xylariales sp. PMI_506]